MLPPPTTIGDLHSAVASRLDLAGDRRDALRVGAVGEVPHERLARELQQYPLERGGHSSPTWKRANRLMTTFSPVEAASSVSISSMVLASCLSAIHVLLVEQNDLFEPLAQPALDDLLLNVLGLALGGRLLAEDAQLGLPEGFVGTSSSET